MIPSPLPECLPSPAGGLVQSTFGIITTPCLLIRKKAGSKTHVEYCCLLLQNDPSATPGPPLQLPIMAALGARCCLLQKLDAWFATWSWGSHPHLSKHLAVKAGPFVLKSLCWSQAGPSLSLGLEIVLVGTCKVASPPPGPGSAWSAHSGNSGPWCSVEACPGHICCVQLGTV